MITEQRPAGRTPDPSIQVAIWLPLDLKRQCKAIAALRNVSMQSVMVEWIAEGARRAGLTVTTTNP